ncbi:hypothetical protein Lesp02_53240 [Lentzea sp. NBRC 105346]|uniref:DUF6802 family protein n=1 Tax=Lentzea sp. NBRC 105346 TaxID=3032205 RepID=UPI0024A2BFE8|nr:DUF6802 family protein [Lentzea sp. NBRC 105346]GLZ33136.1 hypothetical protein Lesp02_53240 [Lentzea sp. NBRC 105346]
MYIDENGAADGELKVTVADEEYTAEATFDLDSDGVNDSAVVETDDGGHLAFTDTDGDGDADLMSTFDKDGKLLSQARFEENSGEWVEVDPNDHTQQKTNSTQQQTIVVDTDEGDRKVGPATEDTDGDGKADTAVVQDADGDTWLFTDRDGDGHADLSTEITRSGEVTMSEHRGDDWVEVEHGHIDSDGRYVTDSKSGVLDDAEEWYTAERFDGVVRIDSTTGQWISPN